MAQSITIRADPQLIEQLRLLAKANHRSLNGQILVVLEEALQFHGRPVRPRKKP